MVSRLLLPAGRNWRIGRISSVYSSRHGRVCDDVPSARPPNAAVPLTASAACATSVSSFIDGTSMRVALTAPRGETTQANVPVGATQYVSSVDCRRRAVAIISAMVAGCALRELSRFDAPGG